MVFFVLSGFVISHTSKEKNHDLREYLLARLSRLYSVAVPALLIAFFVDQLGRRLTPELYPGWTEDAPVWRLLSGLVFINELWFTSVRMPSNDPYWSIGYEFWYYMIFGAAFYLRGVVRVLATSAALAIAGPKILILAPIFFLGVLAHRFVGKVGLVTGGLMFGASLLAYVAVVVFQVRLSLEWRTNMLFPGGRLEWSSEFLWKLLVGALAVVNVIGFAGMARKFLLGFIGRAIKSIAGISFSIYLYHYPLLLLVVICSATWRWTVWSFPSTLLMLGAILVVAGLLSRVTENRKLIARRMLETVWPQSRRLTLNLRR